MSSEQCPCGSAKAYQDCCGKFIEAAEIPETAEELMRSRYTAYTQANIAYIEKTMSGLAAKGFDAISAKEWAGSVTWTSLDVLKTWNGKNENIAYVEFKARFSELDQQKELHEQSEFERKDGCWYYIDAVFPDP